MPAKIQSNLPVLLARKGMRDQHTISQRELARATGVPLYTIGQLMKDGFQRIERDSMLALCLYLDCTPGELFTIIDEDT
jgi:putative transcriptional regulator